MAHFLQADEQNFHPWASRFCRSLAVSGENPTAPASGGSVANTVFASACSQQSPADGPAPTATATQHVVASEPASVRALHDEACALLAAEHDDLAAAVLSAYPPLQNREPLADIAAALPAALHRAACSCRIESAVASGRTAPGLLVQYSTAAGADAFDAVAAALPALRPQLEWVTVQPVPGRAAGCRVTRAALASIASLPSLRKLSLLELDRRRSISEIDADDADESDADEAIEATAGLVHLSVSDDSISVPHLRRLLDSCTKHARDTSAGLTKLELHCSGRVPVDQTLESAATWAPKLRALKELRVTGSHGTPAYSRVRAKDLQRAVGELCRSLLGCAARRVPLECLHITGHGDAIGWFALSGISKLTALRHLSVAGSVDGLRSSTFNLYGTLNVFHRFARLPALQQLDLGDMLALKSGNALNATTSNQVLTILSGFSSLTRLRLSGNSAVHLRELSVEHPWAHLATTIVCE